MSTVADPAELGSNRAYEAARLRWASQGDAERLARLWRDACADEASGEDVPDTTETLQGWLEHGGAVVLEDANGRALCGLRWRWAGSGSGWRVDPIATLPEARGQGFGRWLMTKVEALAIKRNVQSLSLTLPRAQEALLPYYQRLGYREVGRDGAGIELHKRVGGTWQRQPTPAP